MWYLRLAVIFLAAVPACADCGFRFNPVSTLQYYRENGWALPGVSRASAATASFDARLNDLPGAKAYRLMDRRSSPVLKFPAQEFVLDGTRQKTQPFEARATIVQWKVGTRVVAYSYSLNPGRSRHVNGKIVFQGYACIFGLTVIDDRGDGVFRVLIPDQLTPELLPLWAKPKEKS